MRGQVTPDVDRLATAFLGRTINQTELRLLPYIDYVMKNDQKINPTKVNRDEREFLGFLRQGGHIEGGASGLAITRDFYDFVQEVLWYSYVAAEE